MATPLIVLDQVTKQYATHTAVDRLSLSVAGGDVYALLGPNGAGKTVLGGNSLLTLGLIVLGTTLLLAWTRRKLNGSYA